MNTPEIMAALKAKYAPPAYALLKEVGNATGFKCAGWADAVAMGIWPSRGLELEGFEVKASRGDWLKELKNPAKAEGVYGYCDRWWLVAGDAGIVHAGELPPTWGLFVGKGSKLVAVTPAPKLEPKPPSRTFLAALLRRVAEQSVDATELRRARDEGVKVGTESAEQHCKWTKERYESLQKKVDLFNKSSGLNIEHGWQGAEKIGEAVRAVLDGQMPADKIRQVLQWVAQVQKSGEALLREVEGKREKVPA